ncbi:hypothetical protein ANO14919_059390 [Xylariales sp. No.14919]|nr:hypothetical protein ANO14919_059390 [Xylariales sp. No.14919]
MAEETLSRDEYSPGATHHGFRGSVGPQPGANAFERLHSSPAKTQQASDSDTQATFQRTPPGESSDPSLIIPVGVEFPIHNDREHQLEQNDQSIRLFPRLPTPTSPSLTETSVGDLERYASVIAKPPQAKIKHGRWGTIGAWGSFVLIGGCISILAVFTFIAFLWFGGGLDREAVGASRLWQNIVLSGRIGQAITLSSLLLRIVVSAQAASCTSLLAALFLEKRAVPISYLPHFSIARGTNDGPRALLQMVIGSSTRHMLFTLEALLMLVLALAALGLQFSSTILLSDLRNAPIATDPKPTALKTTLSDTAQLAYMDNVADNPVLAIYGEALSNVTVEPDDWGLSDTGLKQRALLPLDYAENRTMVRSYQGSATIGNSRVACMPPTIHGSAVPDPEVDGTVFTGRAQGTLDYNGSFRAAARDSAIPSCLESKCEPLLLDCSVPALVSGSRVPQSSICIIGAVGGDYWPRADGPSWKTSDAPWANRSSIYLILSTNMGKTEWETFQTTPLISIQKYGEWTSYELLPMRYVNISMCFAGFNFVDANVSMATTASLSEPQESWVVPEANGGNTRLSRQFLGADLNHQTPEERGILTLNNPEVVPKSDYSILSGNQTNNQYKINVLEWSTYMRVTNTLNQVENGQAAHATSIMACLFCSTVGVSQNPLIAAILTDIISQTNRAALIMDSWILMVMQAVYYEIHQFLDVTEEVQIGFTRAAEAPGRCWDENGCRGFIAVSALIFIHIVCVASITSLYLSQTRYSRLGNIWHTVSQLQCAELGGVLRESNNAKDDEISKLLKDSSGDHLMRIDLSADGSRIEAVKFEGDPNVLSKKHHSSTENRLRPSHFFRNIFSRRRKDA